MKLAISLEDSIFYAAEHLAKQRHIPRSQLIAEALQEYISHHGPEAITAKLNDIYSAEDSDVEKPLFNAQLTSIEHETW
jgi:metal-responsive CopG/Arc/MetJ family transcriptional regulator